MKEHPDLLSKKKKDNWS